MCTHQKDNVKTALIYLLISGFCAIFGAVYELFSHGVYSYFMLYAYAFPLLLGTLPYLVLSFSDLRPSSLTAQIYHSGVATLTVGSIVWGVLDIYGTTNKLTIWYWIVGGALIGVGAIRFAMRAAAPRN